MNRAKIIASTPKIYEKELKNLKEFSFYGFQKKIVNDVVDRSINFIALRKN